MIAGWARPLGFELIILASDKICQDEWACNAYKLAVPEGINFSCMGLKQCISTLNKKNTDKVMIIVESVREAYNLLTKGLKLKEINIGGLSYKEGTREIASYIYLSQKDIESVVRLYRMGVRIIGRQLPNSLPIDVVKTLAGVKSD